MREVKYLPFNYKTLCTFEKKIQETIKDNKSDESIFFLHTFF